MKSYLLLYENENLIGYKTLFLICILDFELKTMHYFVNKTMFSTFLDINKIVELGKMRSLIIVEVCQVLGLISKKVEDIELNFSYLRLLKVVRISRESILFSWRLMSYSCPETFY